MAKGKLLEYLALTIGKAIFSGEKHHMLVPRDLEGVIQRVRFSTFNRIGLLKEKLPGNITQINEDQCIVGVRKHVHHRTICSAFCQLPVKGAAQKHH